MAAMTTTEANKMPIEFWELDKLIDYPKNAKKHSDEHVNRLARSIARLGVAPLMIEPDGTIIAGHGRKKALIKLGRGKAPVIVRHDLTKQECDALRIADNAAVSAEMDYDMLNEESIRLSDEGFELADLGFTEAEIRAMTVDLGGIDDSAFATDIPTAVEEQKTANATKEAEIDQQEGPIGEAFGFKKVTTEQSRVIRGFMAKIEADTGLAGAAALVAHISQ
jgi:hypothetical protein